MSFQITINYWTWLQFCLFLISSIEDKTYLGSGLFNNNWRHLSLSELTPMISNTGFTHLGSEASNLSKLFVYDK